MSSFSYEDANRPRSVRLCDPRRISGRELRDLGMTQLAYVKAVEHDGEDAFAIHAADGTPMALVDDRASAVEAILDHEMIPASVH